MTTSTLFEKTIGTYKLGTLFNTEYTLAYSQHIREPRFKVVDDVLVREERLVSNFSLNEIAQLISNDVVKMFMKQGKWIIGIRTKANKLLVFILETRKSKNNFRVSVISSYVTSNTQKVLNMGDNRNHIMLGGEYDSEFIHSTPSESEIYEYEQIANQMKKRSLKHQAKKSKRLDRKRKQSELEYRPTSEMFKDNYKRLKALRKVYVASNKTKGQMKAAKKKEQAIARRQKAKYENC